MRTTSKTYNEIVNNFNKAKELGQIKYSLLDKVNTVVALKDINNIPFLVSTYVVSLYYFNTDNKYKAEYEKILKVIEDVFTEFESKELLLKYAEEQSEDSEILKEKFINPSPTLDQYSLF